jgi:LPS-assembly lipoprotein
MTLLALILSACGFQPMYGDRSDAATSANYSNVDILNIPNRDGQYLRNQLIDRMYLNGRPAGAQYTLRIFPLRTLTTNIGIEKDATSTRAMAEVDTTIQLIDNATQKVLLQRDIRATGGYNLLDNQFATIVSRQAVDEHMLEEVADDIVTELGLYFHRAGNTPGQMPVSIAKPTRSPSAPINAPAVGAQPGPVIRNDVTPVTP